MENFIGIWWSGSENDVLPAGQGAHGYKSLTFNAPGTNYQVHRDIKKYVHDKGEASGDGLILEKYYTIEAFFSYGSGRSCCCCSENTWDF